MDKAQIGELSSVSAEGRGDPAPFGFAQDEVLSQWRPRFSSS
jgi:hypothetical protein